MLQLLYRTHRSVPGRIRIAKSPAIYPRFVAMAAEENPELQAKLRALDHELEEGDITEKGYHKRRTLILSQFLNSTHVEQAEPGLILHSPDDTTSSPQDGERSTSLTMSLSRSDGGFNFSHMDAPAAAP